MIVRRRRALGSFVAPVVLGGLALFGAACSDTCETDGFRNPNDPSELDDSVPPVPAYDESLTYEPDGYPINNSTKRFRFDVSGFRNDEEKADASRLYASHAAHLREHFPMVPSVQTVGTYVKQLDDTIYAGIERALQEGLTSAFASKREILSGAFEALIATRGAPEDDAAVYLAAALSLGAVEGATGVNVPTDLQARVTAAVSEFESRPAEAKPIGFYTWSQALRAIWKQDRFLQAAPGTGPAAAEPACALAEAIGKDPTRKERYVTLVSTFGRLTNPVESSLVASLGLERGACVAQSPLGNAFLSSSRSSEVSLFRKLYPGGVPANANLMQDLIDAIRGGTVDLAPKAEDGWYQWQSHALETLLVTDKSEERSKVAFTAKYKKRLQEAFQSMLVQHRETHVKQANRAVFVSAGPPPGPQFHAEPMATVYARHARSYVFLENALDALHGAALLDEAPALGETGTESETLRERLHRARDTFFGLYLLSSFELGMRPQLREGEPAEADWKLLMDSARGWTVGLFDDPIAAKDVRVVVPIASIDETHFKYWAVIGVRTTIASYSEIKGETLAPPDPKDEARVSLPTEQFIEYVASNNPPTREEFRALCDEQKTAEAIQKALEAR